MNIKVSDKQMTSNLQQNFVVNIDKEELNQLIYCVGTVLVKMPENIQGFKDSRFSNNDIQNLVEQKLILEKLIDKLKACKYDLRLTS